MPEWQLPWSSEATVPERNLSQPFLLTSSCTVNNASLHKVQEDCCSQALCSGKRHHPPAVPQFHQMLPATGGLIGVSERGVGCVQAQGCALQPPRRHPSRHCSSAQPGGQGEPWLPGLSSELAHGLTVVVLAAMQARLALTCRAAVPLLVAGDITVNGHISSPHHQKLQAFAKFIKGHGHYIKRLTVEMSGGGDGLAVHLPAPGGGPLYG